MTLDQRVSLEPMIVAAFAYLNRRERTRQEMRQHLLSRGASEDTVEAALHELREQGYLDDGRFCRLFVQDKRQLNGWGSERIHQALLARGISRDVAEAALAAEGEDQSAGVATQGAELRRALEVLDRRFPGGLPDRRESDRALGVLLRKGYEYDLAVEALVSHRRRVR